MKATSTTSSTALSSARCRGYWLPTAFALACYSPGVAGAAQSESWPLPGRNVVPGDAILFLEFSGEVDTTCDIGVSGNKVESKGNVKLVAPLPKRDCFVYVERVEGRGSACVLQDPRRPNGYQTIIRARDPGAGRGKYTIRAYYSAQPPERAGLSTIIRIPNVLQPHYTSSGRFLAPAKPGPPARSCYSMQGRWWGEQPGPVRSLTDPTSTFAFRWQGRIDKYAVLAFDGAQIRLFDCGFSGTRTVDQKLTEHRGGIQDYYLVLSECTPQGRVRVIQPGGAAGTRDAYLIEIDNRETRAAPICRLTGHLIRKEVIDGSHGPDSSCAADWKLATEAEASRNMSRAAEHWISAAIRAEDEGARLWQIQKFCMLQPYPGPGPNPSEEKTLNILQNQALAGDPRLSDSTARDPKDQLLEVLSGKNIILAWPKDYTARVPTKWRFLAELDACIEWLKTWTGNDVVRNRGMRMIARFRVDDSGTALYTGFRVHIPRRNMTIPPDHEPYSHEVSHGFVYFPAISPTGRFAEGLTEVSRAGYWHFLGLDEASTAFRQRCVITLAERVYAGGTVPEASGYGEAAALYFVIMDHFCRAPAGELDWLKLSDLFAMAKVDVDTRTDEAGRWRLLAGLCEKAFGHETRSVLAGLGVPTSGPSVP